MAGWQQVQIWMMLAADLMPSSPSVLLRYDSRGGFGFRSSLLVLPSGVFWFIFQISGKIWPWHAKRNCEQNQPCWLGRKVRNYSLEASLRSCFLLADRKWRVLSSFHYKCLLYCLIVLVKILEFMHIRPKTELETSCFFRVFSERADATGATGERLKEGGLINKSLVTLGTVISHLGNEKITVNGFVFFFFNFVSNIYARFSFHFYLPCVSQIHWQTFFVWGEGMK